MAAAAAMRICRDTSTTCLWRNTVPWRARKIQTVVQDGTEYLLCVRSVKWWPATQEDVEDDATAPNISSLAVATSQHLGRHLVGSWEVVVVNRWAWSGHGVGRQASRCNIITDQHQMVIKRCDVFPKSSSGMALASVFDYVRTYART